MLFGAQDPKQEQEGGQNTRFTLSSFWHLFANCFWYSLDKLSATGIGRYYDIVHYCVHIYEDATIYYTVSYQFPDEHPVLIGIQIVSLVIAFLLYEITRNVDPGYVQAEGRAPVDQLTTCSTCHTPRYTRSKHCQISNRCIYRFDHFCPWTKSPIGAYNHRYYYSFLCVEFVHIICVLISLQYVLRESESSVKFWWLIICFLVAFVLGFGVLSLCLLQTFKITRNITTNETKNHSKPNYLYVSLAPFYKNYFDAGWWTNWKLFWTGYTDEQWKWTTRPNLTLSLPIFVGGNNT